MDALEWAQMTLGHTFRDPALLREALTHTSLHQAGSYQRLEFLGDRVLGLVVAEKLLAEFPKENEGTIARRFVKLVRKETLAEIARSIGVPDIIRLAPAAEQAGVNMQDGVCSDVMESLLGALYTEAGLRPVHAFITQHWSQLMAAEGAAQRDPKTKLQEWAQGRGLALPHYEIVGQTGPDHAPEFVVEVTVEGLPPAQGQAGSKRDAQKQAAARLLESHIS